MLLKPAKDSVDVGIFVSDIKKSLDFYQGILGLEKTEEVQTGFGTLHRLRYGTSDVKLMDPKKVPPAGLIGLEKQLGIRYLTFVIDELMPFIARKYPTLDGPEHAGFGGSSYGAANAFYAVLSRPGVFGRGFPVFAENQAAAQACWPKVRRVSTQPATTVQACRQLRRRSRRRSWGRRRRRCTG